MTILNRIESNWSRVERERLNTNWSIIENYFSNLQGQINILTGEVNVQELIDQLNNVLNEGTVLIDELKESMSTLETIILDAQNATDTANNAAQSALNAINDIQSMIDNYQTRGTYDNETIYEKNNSVFLEGSSYIYINDSPSKGNPPPPYPTVSNAFWHMTAAKGAAGDGAVSKVNGKEPNSEGEITLVPDDIGAANKQEVTESLSQLEQKVEGHINDNVRHVTANERNTWNNKKPLKSTGAMATDPNTVQDPTFLCRHSNMGDGGANYWYVEQTWYDQTNNRMQQATSYSGDQPIFKIRHCYGDTWSPWSNASPYLVVGQNASVTGWAGIAIGPNAKATNNGAAIGVNCEAYDGSIAMGRGVKAYTGSDGQISAVFGVSSDASNGGFTLGNGAVSSNKGIGVLGGAANIGSTTYQWNVPGNLSVSGTKNFEIPHPHPDKKYTHVIRHGAVESPTAGDTLYRYKVEATTDGETVEVQLPDYFEHLNTNIDVWVNPHKHFGRAFGEVIGDKLLVTCEKAGAYKALVIGTRNDDNVQDWHIKGVEREVGESWLGETFVFEIEEIAEINEFGEGV